MASGIADHLQDGGGILIGESALEESESVISERVVHVDEEFSLLPSLLVRKLYIAREIHGNIGPQIAVVAKVDERDLERIVVALSSDFQGVSFPFERELLSGESQTREPSADYLSRIVENR